MQPANHPMARSRAAQRRMRGLRQWRRICAGVSVLAMGVLATGWFLWRIFHPVPHQPTKDRPVAVVDAGHGAFTSTGVLDVGAAHFGATEAALVLDIALRLQQALERHGWVAVTTRDGEFTPYSLGQRAQLAAKVGADVLVSLHLNSHPSRQARGVEVFYWHPDAQPLAELLQQRLSKELQLRNRGIGRYPFTVIAAVPVPAVLIELGFLSHRQEARRLQNPHFREKAAQVIAEALTEWWQKQQRERLATLSSSVPLRH